MLKSSGKFCILCVYFSASGCDVDVEVSNGVVVQSYNGSVLTIHCRNGTILDGRSDLLCDGQTWSSPAPKCLSTFIAIKYLIFFLSFYVSSCDAKFINDLPIWCEITNYETLEQLKRKIFGCTRPKKSKCAIFSPAKSFEKNQTQFF